MRYLGRVVTALEPPDLTALELAAAIRHRQIGCLEALDACLHRVDERDRDLGAIVWRDDEGARAAARRADDRVARTPAEELPPFMGVPIPIKDLTLVEGWPVTFGSRGASPEPSDQDELVVAALRRAGFTLACRTNTPEFGLISAAENLRYPPSRNPWDLSRTPGGSSGGAAAAVAGGLFPLAHGNDGGGSLRIPASCCGLVGLKVSRGRIPALVTYWDGAAVEGVLTRTVADTAAVLDQICGPDPLCWYNAPRPDRPFRQEVGKSPGPLRLGVLTEAPLGLPLSDPCRAAVEEVAGQLRRLGHEVVPAPLELPPEVVSSFMRYTGAGLADFPEIDWERTEPHVRAAREAAQNVDSLAYTDATHILQRFSRQLMARWGAEFDLLVTPTLTIEPPKVGEVLAAAHEAGPGPALPVLQMAVLTSIFNVSGQPAISLPLAATAAGLPIGVQVVGHPFDEAGLLRLAAQLESAMPWSGRKPDREAGLPQGR